jgi:hypothetical protein
MLICLCMHDVWDMSEHTMHGCTAHSSQYEYHTHTLQPNKPVLFANISATRQRIAKLITDALGGKPGLW